MGSRITNWPSVVLLRECSLTFEPKGYLQLSRTGSLQAPEESVFDQCTCSEQSKEEWNEENHERVASDIALRERLTTKPKLEEDAGDCHIEAEKLPHGALVMMQRFLTQLVLFQEQVDGARG